MRRRAGIERELGVMRIRDLLRWFGHVVRTNEHRMARRVLMADESGGLLRGRLRLGWMDGAKVVWAVEGRLWRLRDNVRKIGKSREP